MVRASMELTPQLERRVVLVLAAVQFVNIVDFMMVMPLGPDFAAALGIPESELGVIGGSYTAAAAVSGLVCAFFLDRFDRRPALALSLLGLCVGTLGGAFAQGLPSLVAARVLAGVFGGPATALTMSIVADVIPAARRGAALGTVMIAFSAAAILGVPAGLELACWGSWHTPFVATAVAAALAAIGARLLLPSLTSHLDGDPPEPVGKAFLHLLSAPLTQISYLMTALVMFGAFILIPNIAAYVQKNLAYPREHMGLLYLAGGLGSFVTLRPFGRLVDRFGAFGVGAAGIASISVITWLGFGQHAHELPVLPLFIAFMTLNGLRNVAYNTLTSRVPTSHERARFMSLQSMVQHLAAALGAMLSSRLLGTGAGGKLIGMERIALLSIAASLLVIPLLYLVERRVLARGAAPAH